MPDEGAPEGWVDLSDAIAALRRDLANAWEEGQEPGNRVRFKFEPVDLTVQAGVTRARKGEAGVKWHILALGGNRSKKTTMTQTLHLRFSPIFVDEESRPLPRKQQLASGLDDDSAPGGTEG